jgi:hypothetical protein
MVLACPARTADSINAEIAKPQHGDGSMLRIYDAYVAIAKIDVPAGLDNLKLWRERVAGRPSIARA